MIHRSNSWRKRIISGPDIFVGCHAPDSPRGWWLTPNTKQMSFKLFLTPTIHSYFVKINGLTTNCVLYMETHTCTHVHTRAHTHTHTHTHTQNTHTQHTQITHTHNTHKPHTHNTHNTHTTKHTHREQITFSKIYIRHSIYSNNKLLLYNKKLIIIQNSTYNRRYNFWKLEY